MRYLLLVFIALALRSAASGQVSNGYIIRASGDTLRGMVYISEIGAYEVMKFEKDGVETKYRPYELKGYGIRGTHYVSLVRPKEGTRAFLRLAVRGYCSLYYYSEAGAPAGVGMMPTIRSWMYLQKEGEKDLHYTRYQQIKYGKDTYLNDNPGLINDIRKGKYGARHFDQVIERYNAERFTN